MCTSSSCQHRLGKGTCPFTPYLTTTVDQCNHHSFVSNEHYAEFSGTWYNLFFILSLTLGYFRSMHKNTKLFENYLNPAMLVFIGQLSLRTLRRVPMCQGFSHFAGLLHHFVLAKLATSSIRPKKSCLFPVTLP